MQQARAPLVGQLPGQLLGHPVPLRPCRCFPHITLRLASTLA
jgi:hypothetical protein